MNDAEVDRACSFVDATLGPAIYFRPSLRKGGMLEVAKERG